METRDRILALDVLRGLAIFGILLIHVPAMGLPDSAWQAARSGAAAPLDVLGLALITAGVELKFWALFSLLFGAGIALQARRVEARGGHHAPLFLRRMGSLALIGLVHGLLLFPWEVLFIYAAVGLVFYPFRRLPPALKIVVAAVLLTSLGALGLGLSFAESEPAEASATVEEFRDMGALEALAFYVEANTESISALDREAALGGSPSFTLRMRGVHYGGWLLICFLFLNLRVLGLFFLGAALLELGYFERGHRLHRPLMLVALAVGLPLEVLYATAEMWAPPALAQTSEAIHLVSSLILALGLASAVIRAAGGTRLVGLWRALAAVGRTALSNYLLQSLILNLLFFWWGLGLWGRVGFLPGSVLALAIFGLQAALSSWWLTRFRQGPLEWLWRRAIGGTALRG